MEAFVRSTSYDVIIQYKGPGRHSFECVIKPLNFMVCDDCNRSRVTGWEPSKSPSTSTVKDLKKPKGPV